MLPLNVHKNHISFALLGGVCNKQLRENKTWPEPESSKKKAQIFEFAMRFIEEVFLYEE